MVMAMFIDYINLHKKRALFIDVGTYSNILKLKYLDYNYILLDYFLLNQSPLDVRFD